MAVVAFEVQRSQPFADGQEFGAVGAYTRIDGVLTFAVDPLHRANAGIADLDLAPRDAEGRVRFQSDVVLISATEFGRGNGALLLDVPNRGRSVAGWLNGSVDRGARPLGPVAFEPFDGHIFRRGFATLTVGWQTDMVPIEHSLAIRPPIAGTETGPVTGQVWAELRAHRDVAFLEVSQLGNRGYPPLDREEPTARLYEYTHEAAAPRLLPRDRWQFARIYEGREEPSDHHICLEGGFRAGHIYRVVYEAMNPPVVGAGLLALRDAAVFFRRGADGSLPGQFDRVIGFGVSQTGRVLRHFLNLGLNADEDGARVLDGVLAIIASGLGRGEYNQRFALPSGLGARSFGELFPFADATMTDPHTGATGGVLARAEQLGTVPKVVYLNSAYEYWVSHASLTHTDPATGVDAPIHPSVRSYLVAGAQHSAGNVPQSRDMAALGASARYGLDVVAYAPLVRAALVNLDAWLISDLEPPPSRVPREAEGTAATRESTLERYRELPGVEPPPAAHLRVIRQLDFGPDAERGIGTYPPLEGPAYACLVSTLDDDLNDVAGIRLPDITVPIGTHVGWNVLETGKDTSEHVPVLQGMTRFFSRDEAERAALGDPRASIAARYPTRDAYLERVRVEAQRLVSERFLLADDIDLVVENCAARYDEALQVSPYSPP